MPHSAHNLRFMAKYRLAAAHYDATAGPTWPIHLRCIEMPGLRKGETVLDVGCGTGLSLDALLRKVGRSGDLLAFEQSPRMHAQAQTRAPTS